jgi:outer membrane biosynthesis protein TonB
MAKWTPPQPTPAKPVVETPPVSEPTSPVKSVAEIPPVSEPMTPANSVVETPPVSESKPVRYRSTGGLLRCSNKDLKTTTINPWTEIMPGDICQEDLKHFLSRGFIEIIPDDEGSDQG